MLFANDYHGQAEVLLQHQHLICLLPSLELLLQIHHLI